VTIKPKEIGHMTKRKLAGSNPGPLNFCIEGCVGTQGGIPGKGQSGEDSREGQTKETLYVFSTLSRLRVNPTSQICLQAKEKNNKNPKTLYPFESTGLGNHRGV
jgi:hypothetical protein